MILIDASYFIGQITIAQVETPPVSENLQLFIEKYEPEILRKLLGKDFYRAFVNGLQAPTPEQRWIDLRNGVEDEWMGFTNDLKQSIIANYVYYWYTRDQASQTVGMGESLPKAENAERFSFANKQVRAWNEMVDWIHELYHFLREHQAEYPEFEPRFGYMGHRHGRHRYYLPFARINPLNI